MIHYQFNKSLYSKVALLKAAYNYTDKAFIHLDVDDSFYYVDIEMKSSESTIEEKEFQNEMLAQAIRHEIYLQTKNIRELMLARSMATSIVAETDEHIGTESVDEFTEDEILKDWFEENDKTSTQ